MAGPESLNPDQVRRTGGQGGAAAQAGGTSVTTSATTAATGTGATSNPGRAVASLVQGAGGQITSATNAATKRVGETDQATQDGATKIEDADGRGGARFNGDGTEAAGTGSPGGLDAKSITEDAERRAKELTGQDPMSQFGQVAAQAGQGLLQAGAQGFQQVGQMFQQIPQQAGQGVQQVSQLMSGLAEKGGALDPSKVTGVDDPGIGAGVDPGIDVGGGGGGLGGDDFAGVGGGGVGDTGAGSDNPAQVGGASIGPAVMPIGVGGGVPAVATPTSGMPMGGMPMAPMMGRPGGGANDTKRSEITGESAIYDERTQGLPVVEQVIGGIPTIAIEEPSWETSTVGAKA